MALEPAQAQSCGGVAPGAKGEAGVEAQHDRVFQRLGWRFVPARHNPQAPSDRLRFELLLSHPYPIGRCHVASFDDAPRGRADRRVQGVEQRSAIAVRLEQSHDAAHRPRRSGGDG